MRDRRTIELLSPAKNAECAIAAIKAGADAVYMGASSFGARSLAGNSFDAIKKSADFAHLFGARVYITLNTILFDGEVEQARETAFKACDAGADALSLLNLFEIAIHHRKIAPVSRPEYFSLKVKSLTHMGNPAPGQRCLTRRSS